MKTIWIVNFYSTPPEFASNERHLKFAHYLTENGYKVIIFSSAYFRDGEIDLIKDNSKYIEVNYGEYNFVHIKVKEHSGNGINRMIAIFQFAYRLLKYRKQFIRPDIILHNMHAPFDYLVSRCAKKLKSKYIAEAWDLWPDQFVRFGLIGKKNPILPFLYYVEKKIYMNADAIVFSMEGGIDYLKSRKWTKSTGGKIDENEVYYINNGVDIADFDLNKIRFCLNDTNVEDKFIFKVVYMGSIRLANNIKQLIDAANLLRDYNEIKFLIYGDGCERDSLENYSKEKCISNVIFKQKHIPLTYVPYVLSNASLNILNYQEGFGKYGISSGKLFQSLASGKPIVSNIKINYDVISANNLGIAEDLNTPEKYANAIFQIYKMDKREYNNMCDRVRETAKEFDYKVLSNKLIDVINAL